MRSKIAIFELYPLAARIVTIEKTHCRATDITIPRKPGVQFTRNYPSMTKVLCVMLGIPLFITVALWRETHGEFPPQQDKIAICVHAIDTHKIGPTFCLCAFTSVKETCLTAVPCDSPAQDRTGNHWRSCSLVSALQSVLSLAQARAKLSSVAGAAPFGVC